MNPVKNISQKINKVVPFTSNDIGQKTYEKIKSKGVSSSATGVSGYLRWQYLHLPFSDIQLITGIKSQKASWCLQYIHMERPCTIENSSRFFLDEVFA